MGDRHVMVDSLGTTVPISGTKIRSNRSYILIIWNLALELGSLRCGASRR